MVAKIKRKRKRAVAKKIRAAKFEPCEIRFDTHATVDLRAADGGDKPDPLKRFDIEAYRGGSLSLPGFEHPVYIDCSRVRVHGEADQQPILKEHDPQKVVGHGTPVVGDTTLRVEGGVISHDNEHSRSILAAANKGFKWQASVGGKMTSRPIKLGKNQTRLVNDRRVTGPAFVLSMMWRETSMCTIGCDDERADARIAASLKGAITMDFEQWLEAQGLSADDMDETTLNALKASFAKEQELAELKASMEEDADADDDEAEDEEDAEDDSEEDADAEDVDAAGPDDAIIGASQPKKKPKRKRKRRRTVNPDDLAQQDINAYLGKVRDARRAEDARIKDVEKIAAEYEEHVPKAIHAALVDQAIAGDLDRNQFELQLLKEARKPKEQVLASGRNAGRTGGYRRRKFDKTVIEASMLRSGGMQEEAVVAAVRRESGEDKVEEIMNKSTEKQMQGFGLQDLVYACIESSGEEIPSRRMNIEVIESAMHISREIRATASPSSTVSLPGTLSNIANKQMLQAYEDNQGVWGLICSTTDTNDFKQFDSFRLTEAGVLEPVGPSGEIKHTTLGEDSFQNRVVNHARLLALTEEMIMNDDLGAFQRLARHFGRMSAHAIEQTVIQTLTAAATAAAAGAPTDFFRGAALDNSQPNYLTGAASALGIDSLGDAWKLFANQTDNDGKPVMIEPGVLLTTTGDAILSKNLYNSMTVRLAGAGGDTPNEFRTRESANPWHEMFQPAHSSYLSQAAMNPGGATNVETQWYLAAQATDDFAAMQVAFLSGQRTPQVERFDFDPNMLGVTFRARLPFGVALQDPRCIVKSDGQ